MQNLRITLSWGSVREGSFDPKHQRLILKAGKDRVFPELGWAHGGCWGEVKGKELWNPGCMLTHHSHGIGRFSRFLTMVFGMKCWCPAIGGYGVREKYSPGLEGQTLIIHSFIHIFIHIWYTITIWLIIMKIQWYKNKNIPKFMKLIF